MAGAAGAALVGMVARLTVGKKGFEDVAARMGEIERAADGARAKFLELADRDAASFDAVMAAFKLPRDDEEQKAVRTEAIQRAMVGAAEVPMDTARAAVAVMELAREVTETGNPQASSDGAAAAELLASACRAALRNVEINLASIKDEATVEGLMAETDVIEHRAEELRAAATAAFRTRLGS